MGNAALLLKFISISKGALNCKLFRKLSGQNVLHGRCLAGIKGCICALKTCYVQSRLGSAKGMDVLLNKEEV